MISIVIIIMGPLAPHHILWEDHNTPTPLKNIVHNSCCENLVQYGIWSKGVPNFYFLLQFGCFFFLDRIG